MYGPKAGVKNEHEDADGVSASSCPRLTSHNFGGVQRFEGIRCVFPLKLTDQQLSSAFPLFIVFLVKTVLLLLKDACASRGHGQYCRAFAVTEDLNLFHMMF